MTRLALAALVVQLAACERASENLPPVPGGGGGTGSQFMPDADVGGGDDGGATINGRVCLLLTNPHSLATCAATGASNFTVTLGTAMATTLDDGSFTLMRPTTTTGLVWRVTANGIVTSAIKFGAPTTLPALDSLTYQDMLASTNASIGAGTGAVMVRVQSGNFPVANATVAAVPAPDSGTYYDGPSYLEWQPDATGNYGVAWLPSVATGNVQLTVTANQMNHVLAAQPVFQNAITFVVAEIP
jgi:hypothetical protein